jgi:hypothetical protein
MYGESKAIATGSAPVNSRETEVHDMSPTLDGGYFVRLTGNFPLTDLEILMPANGPRHIRFGQDCDGDGLHDTQTTAALTFRDLDGDGVIRRNIDAAHVRVIHVEPMPGVPVHFTVAERLAAARRVVEMLGGRPGEIVSEQELREVQL